MHVYYYHLRRTDSYLDLLNSVITRDGNQICYAWFCSQATASAVEVTNTDREKKNTHESVEIQGKAGYFLWHPGYCGGRVIPQRPSGKSAVTWPFS